MDTGRREGFDIVILDTAGRLSINQELMDEVTAIRAATNPAETLLVVDAMTGQDAVNTAKAFNEALGVTGIVLTRMDGDARGGAALSMRADHRRADQAHRRPARSSTRWRISTPSASPAASWAWATSSAWSRRPPRRSTRRRPRSSPRKMAKGQFDLEDYANQLKQITKMGSLSGILGMLPGVGKIKAQLEDANLDTTMLKRQAAIISLDDARRSAARRTSSRRAARSASPPARAPRCRRSTGC